MCPVEPLVRVACTAATTLARAWAGMRCLPASTRATARIRTLAASYEYGPKSVGGSEKPALSYEARNDLALDSLSAGTPTVLARLPLPAAPASSMYVGSLTPSPPTSGTV